MHQKGVLEEKNKGAKEVRFLTIRCSYVEYFVFDFLLVKLIGATLDRDGQMR